MLLYFKYLGSFGCLVSIVCCLGKRLVPLPTYNINLLKLKSVGISWIRGKHVPFHYVSILNRTIEIL